MSHNHGKSGSPAHILMSHGGHQMHLGTHDVFHPKAKKYAAGGHAVGDEDEGKEKMRRGGRRRSHRHMNPHTGHPEYFDFGNFLKQAQGVAGKVKNGLNTGLSIANQLAPMAQQFLPSKVGNAIGQGLNMANTAGNMANTAGNMFGFAEGGHVNHESGHPEYFDFGNFLKQAQGIAGKVKNGLNTGLSIANQLAPVAQQFLPSKVGNAIGQGLNMANTAGHVANTAGNMFGFAEGGHVNHGSGHPEYYGFNDFIDTLGHVGGALAPLTMFLAQGGQAVPMEGQARANAHGGGINGTMNQDRGGGMGQYGYAQGGPSMMHPGMHHMAMQHQQQGTPPMRHGGRRKRHASGGATRGSTNDSDGHPEYYGMGDVFGHGSQGFKNFMGGAKRGLNSAATSIQALNGAFGHLLPPPLASAANTIAQTAGIANGMGQAAGKTFGFGSGGRPCRRAAGGAGKTRKEYPYT
jgi:hypothetical protein